MLNGLRLLVVDDDRDSRELLIVALESEGAEVTAVSSVEDALLAIQQSIFDILVSDIRMPGEDGYSLIQKVRAAEACRTQPVPTIASEPAEGIKSSIHLPAIALTAFARPEDRIEALEAGFQQHLAKPVNLDELIAVIAELAGR